MKQLKIVIILLFLTGSLFAQSRQETRALLIQFNNYINNGNFFEAKEIISRFDSISPLKSGIDPWYFYTDYGLVYSMLGQQEKALYYYGKAEQFCPDPAVDPYPSIDNYSRRATENEHLHNFKKSSILYETALNLLDACRDTSLKYLNTLSQIELNYGIMLYTARRYEESKGFLRKSLKLKTRYNMTYLSSAYFNLARISDKQQDYMTAGKYYCLAMRAVLQEFGEASGHIAAVYLEYSELLVLRKNFSMAKVYLDKALAIYQEIYGFHHSITASVYQVYGDFYHAQGKDREALIYYQNALMSITEGFTNKNIYSNPTQPSIKDNRLVIILQNKSRALATLADSEKSIDSKNKLLTCALQTVKLGISVNDSMRNRYIHDESRYFQAENEKELYLQGINCALQLFENTGNKDYSVLAYTLASEWKGAELDRQLNTRDAINNAATSDSILKNMLSLEEEMKSLENQSFQEGRKPNPDSAKIRRWKASLYTLNLRYEDLHRIASTQPWYERFFTTPEIPSLNSIRNRLARNQNLVEYVMPDEESELQEMYIFVISKNGLHYVRQKLKPQLRQDMRFFRNTMVDLQHPTMTVSKYDSLKNVLYNFYNCFFRPMESYLHGQQVYIIPDGDINYLPFESFISDNDPGGTIDFSSLKYLIRKYDFSYAYSITSLFKRKGKETIVPRVFAFSPQSLKTNDNDLPELEGSGKELESISTVFRGTYLKADEATRDTFRKLCREPGIFHLAMHAMNDDQRNDGNYLIFTDAERLYDYEISMLNMKSPLVVLSACNTGSGKLIEGEGMLCLTRSFLEAGARSVIHTLWPANDATGPLIMKRFYLGLSRGERKNSALRDAKLEYLSKVSPSMANPYYWSAYQLVGSIKPIQEGGAAFKLLLLIFPLALIIYWLPWFRRRRSLRASLR